MDVRVRRATIGDLDAIVELTLDEAKEAAGPTTNVETIRRGVQAGLLAPAVARYWVLESEGGEIVGGASAVREQSDWNNTPYWWIESMYMRPAWRGQGYARMLIQAVAEAGRAEGTPELRLYVHQDNAKAMEVYHHEGFRRTPYVVMTKTLRGKGTPAGAPGASETAAQITAPLAHPEAETLVPYKQPSAFLELLIQYLACPFDNTVSVTPIRSPEGEVISLRSENGEFPVVSNVPCMLPDLVAKNSGSLALWRELQETIWGEYKAGFDDFAFFSQNDDPIERAAGLMIDGIVQGVLLDVGCGVTQLPGYMTAASENTVWIGLDPYWGEAARWFPFVQGLAENLPFRPRTFDGVLFAGTLDHVIDPQQSLIRAHSVIKPKGKLIIWNDLNRGGPRYLRWKALRGLGVTNRYDHYHQWQFTERSLRALIRAAGFSVEEIIEIKRGDFLAVARPA